jgi:hypothetical protein
VDYRRSANFFGPYRRTENLLGDLRRLNLFRKAEIHTVSMGDADLYLMHRIAMLGLGKYRNLGGNGVLVLNGASALEFDLPEKPGIFTLECWVKGPKPNRESALVADTEQSGFGLFYLDRGMARPGAAVRDTEGYVRVEAGIDWRWKGWNHLAMTFDGASLRLYVNGRPAGTKESGKLLPSTRPLVVGAEPTEKVRPRWFFRGQMDEIRLSDSVRYEGTFVPAKVHVADGNTLLLLQFDGEGETPFDDASAHRRPVKVHGDPRVRCERR